MSYNDYDNGKLDGYNEGYADGYKAGKEYAHIENFECLLNSMLCAVRQIEFSRRENRPTRSSGESLSSE